MRPKSETLTGQELEIMKVIWPLGHATVRDVYDALRQRRTVAYTTVQTMMNILETKGHLKKEPGEKAQIYAPVRPQHLVVRSMVREFVNRVFDGSARPIASARSCSACSRRRANDAVAPQRHRL
jgi:BlaI family penicillinase repressor